MADIGYMANYPSDGFTTPDHSSLRLTGDFDLRILIRVPKWITTGRQWPLIFKYDNSANGYYNYSWIFYDDGKMRLRLSTDGTTLLDYGCTAAVPFTNGQPYWCRVTRASATGAINFYYASTDFASGVPTSWTQLGTTVTGVTGTLYAGTAILRLAYDRQSGNGLCGNVYAAQLRDGIDGTIVASPDFRASAAGTQSYTDAQGRVWTAIYRCAVMTESSGGGGFSRGREQ